VKSRTDFTSTATAIHAAGFLPGRMAARRQPPAALHYE
jgi:hypothetical protein